jgi:hypothetical protein
MDYRLNKSTLLEILGQWNGFIHRKVHLIACGGTAITLMDIKPSTRDVDFIVPIVSEYNYLIRVLKDLGYQQTTGHGWQKNDELFIFDLFPGNRIHTTELLRSPLEEGNHRLLKAFSRLYIGILNDYDLISSKLFRGSNVDFDDCLMLIKAHQDRIDIEHLKRHFSELARYDISENRIRRHLEHFLAMLREERQYG